MKRSRLEYKSGFTIVELLVAIAVIAILAAVTYVGYNGIQSRSRISTLVTDLRTAASQLETYRSNNGGYPTTASVVNNNQGFKASNGVTFTYKYGSSSTYCLSATSSFANIAKYKITNQSTEPQIGDCTVVLALQAIDDSCAIASGKVFCWGYNYYGTVGDGTTNNSLVPVVVTDSGVLAGKTVTAVSRGNNHTCVIADGQPVCWGDNSNGQLGDSTTASSLVPVAFTTNTALAGKTVTAISTGGGHTCAIANGQVYCWGRNTFGQLGNGTTTNSFLPVAVDTSGVLAGKTVTAMSSGNNHVCVVASGQAYCWGETYNGAIGDGTAIGSFTTRTSPVAVTVASGVLAGKTVTAVSSDSNNTCVVASGQAFCWGKNSSGQIGDGTKVDRTSPVAVISSGVLAGKTVTDINTGSNHVCVIASSQAYCWGYNQNGQIGDNTYTERLSPVAVISSGVLSGKTITAISSGGQSNCVLASAQVYCWGYNQFGNVGDGTVFNRPTPVSISPLP